VPVSVDMLRLNPRKDVVDDDGMVTLMSRRTENLLPERKGMISPQKLIRRGGSEDRPGQSRH
jgi:hypothetical protein